MTNPTNPPAEAAMQPVWATIRNCDGYSSQVTFRDQAQAERSASRGTENIYIHGSWRASQLIELSEHDRVVAEKDGEIARLREALAELEVTTRDVIWVSDRKTPTWDKCKVALEKARAALQPETKG